MKRWPPPPTRVDVDPSGRKATFRPKSRDWRVIAFLSFWLAGSNLVMALFLSPFFHPDTTSEVKVLFTGLLAFWGSGMVAALVQLAWVAVGSESAEVTPKELVIEKRIGPLARVRRYPLTEVKRLRARQFVYGAESKNMLGGDSLHFEWTRRGHKAKRVYFGQGTRPQALTVARRLREHLPLQ